MTNKRKPSDKQILEALRKNLYWDGYGYWLPDICIKEREGEHTFTPEPTEEEFRQAIIQRYLT